MSFRVGRGREEEKVFVEQLVMLFRNCLPPRRKAAVVRARGFSLAAALYRTTSFFHSRFFCNFQLYLNEYGIYKLFLQNICPFL